MRPNREMVIKLARAVRHQLSDGAFTIAIVIALVAIFMAVADAQVRATLRSIPPGAVVLVDGVAIGRTPLEHAALPEDSKKLTFKLDGHVDSVCPLALSAHDLELDVVLALEAPGGSTLDPGAIPGFLSDPEAAVALVIEVGADLALGHVERPRLSRLLCQATTAIFQGIEGLRIRDARRNQVLGDLYDEAYANSYELPDAPRVQARMREEVAGDLAEIEIDGMEVFTFPYDADDIRSSVNLKEAIALARKVYDPSRALISDELIAILAINGMLGGLTDRHTHFSPPAADAFLDEEGGHVSGVGLQLAADADGRVRVVSAIAGTPAALTCIQPGDAVLAVNDTATLPFDLDGAVNALRGEPGTEVVITVARLDEVLPPIAMVRELVPIKCTSASYFEEQSLGYLRLDSFPGEWVSGEVADNLDQLLELGARGLVLDLRGNPGGQLDQAARVADFFIDEGVLVSTESPLPQIRSVHNATAATTRVPHDLPVAILIDRGTASAAEVLAGALLAHGRARIIGETSYGKGSVQIVLPLSECECALVLTVGRYVLPDGKVISGDGLHAEDEVLITIEERNVIRARSLYGSEDPRTGDRQLAAALLWLTNELNQR